MYDFSRKMIVITDQYLGVEKIRKRLAVNRKAVQKFDGERFNLKKLNELKLRKQYEIDVIYKFRTLQNLSDDEDINRASENIKESI